MQVTLVPFPPPSPKFTCLESKMTLILNDLDYIFKSKGTTLSPQYFGQRPNWEVYSFIFFSNICPMVMTSRRTNASNYLKEDFYLFIFVFLELLTIPFFPLRRLEDSFMLILFFYFSFLLAINVEPAKMQFLVAVLAVYHNRKKSQIRSFSLAWSSSFSQLPRDFK